MMTSVVDTQKIDLAPWGYAPGRTLYYCCDCNNEGPEQGHRHATRCATHALEARMRDIRMLEASPQDFDIFPPEPCHSSLLLRAMVIGASAIGGILIFGMAAFSG